MKPIMPPVLVILIGVVCLLASIILAVRIELAGLPHFEPYSVVRHGGNCWTYIEQWGSPCATRYTTKAEAQTARDAARKWMYDYHHGLKEKLDAQSKLESSPGYWEVETE